MGDLERYQAMTNDELYQELFRIHERLRLKMDAIPRTRANAKVHKSFADVDEVMDALRRRRERNDH